jgi:4-hydroxy-tetrahydrodipicolinate reductase
MVKICVAGACGKMGKKIVALALKDAEIEVVSLLESPECPDILRPFDKTSGGCDLIVMSDPSEACSCADCLIDFTLPGPTLTHLEQCVKRSVGMVIGTTGFDREEENKISAAAKKIPIVFSPNMAVGVNLVFKMVSDISGILGKDFSVRIEETHHIHKKDSPSGTAKKIASCVRENGGQDPSIEAFRVGEVVGEHAVVFDGEYERIEVRHSAKDRDVFAYGAIRAAKFLKGKPAGIYSMADVLNV